MPLILDVISAVNSGPTPVHIKKTSYNIGQPCQVQDEERKKVAFTFISNQNMRAQSDSPIITAYVPTLTYIFHADPAVLKVPLENREIGAILYGLHITFLARVKAQFIFYIFFCNI